MSRAIHFPGSSRWKNRTTASSTFALILMAIAGLPAHAVNFPVTPEQRSTAQKVAEAGVALSELAPNAPDSYTVKQGDTLWDISRLFLRRPWRWPELWGMNLDQIRNPHLIFPGQVLLLDKSNGRARLRVGKPLSPSGFEKLSPQSRTEAIGLDAIPPIKLSQIEPFLNEAVILQTNELESAPRVVAAPENRVIITTGDIAYVRGELQPTTPKYRIYREPKPLTDPITQEVLGFEAAYVGTAAFMRAGNSGVDAKGDPFVVPATVSVTSARQEVRIGDRLASFPKKEYGNFIPRSPARPVDGRVISVYGEAIYAAKNQIVAINRGAVDGLESGHVLSLWRAGISVIDRTGPENVKLNLPDEPNGNLMIFQVFDRISYGLIMSSHDSIKRGDRIAQP
ncbi:MAG: LysM peptidoglycan-binding domain-containing protein [Burkholderiales bacterium]